MMHWLGEFLRRLRFLWNRDRFSDELAEEFETHRELAAEENRESGTEAGEARSAALRRFGSGLISTPPVGLERVFREYVSASYFPILGLQPAAGRSFSRGDDDIPSTNVAISHAYWRRRFEASPAAIGARVRFAGRDHTLIGVAPPGFSGMVAEADGICGRHLAERAAGVAERDRKKLLESRLELAPAGAAVSYLARQHATPLLALAALAGLVLFLACANIAIVLLARAAARERELAIRLAIGAGRGRLVRQLLTESLVLALLGGAVGILVAHAGAHALVRNYTDAMIRIEVGPDRGVLAFTALVSIAAGLLFGVVPSLRASRGEIGSALRGRWDARRALAAAQIALSLPALAGAALFARTLVQLKTADPGFTPEQLTAFSVNTTTGYPAPGDPAVRRLLGGVRQLPGVIAAGTGRPPPREGPRFRVRAPGFTPVTESDSEVSLVEVGERYLETVGMRLLTGRSIGASPAAVRWSVMRDTLLLAAGLGAGIPAFALSARWLQSLLYGVKPADPAAVGGAVALLVGITLLAGYLPARRASSIALLEALRQD